MKRKIVIAGGTGFLGRAIVKRLEDMDAEIIVLTRKDIVGSNNIRYVKWDAETIGDWAETLEQSSAVLNFAGRSVNCRYTEKNKEEIIRSRVRSTEIIGKAIQAASIPPKLWINAGSTAIFGSGGDDVKNETSSLGEGFSAEVCKQWEAAFNSIDTPSTRKLLCRIGLVFQKNTGLLQPFVKLVKLGFGGKMGTGNQFISWIHEEDFLSILNAAIERDDFAGMIHCASPFPVTNDHFMRALRESLNISFGLPNPAFLLRAGAAFIGTEAELILTGRRVVSKVLEEKNISFRYPTIETARHDLVD